MAWASISTFCTHLSVLVSYPTRLVNLIRDNGAIHIAGALYIICEIYPCQVRRASPVLPLPLCCRRSQSSHKYSPTSTKYSLGRTKKHFRRSLIPGQTLEGYGAPLADPNKSPALSAAPTNLFVGSRVNQTIRHQTYKSVLRKR